VEIAAIIVAAGRGHRAGGGMPKQYRFAGDKIGYVSSFIQMTRAFMPKLWRA